MSPLPLLDARELILFILVVAGAKVVRIDGTSTGGVSFRVRIDIASEMETQAGWEVEVHVIVGFRRTERARVAFVFGFYDIFLPLVESLSPGTACDVFHRVETLCIPETEITRLGDRLELAWPDAC